MANRIAATHLAEMPVRWEGLIVTFAYDVVDERIELVEVKIRCEDGGGIPVARRPPLARLAAQALQELRSRWAPQIIRQQPSETAVAAAAVLLNVPGPRRGRPPLYDVDHWVEVARTYTEDGGVLAVQARWSLGYPTAWGWVRRTRELGLLPPQSGSRLPP